MKMLARVLGASAAAAVCLTTGTVVPATPADASTGKCIDYLESYGWVANSKMLKACQVGAKGDTKQCMAKLMGQYVPKSMAAAACIRAKN
ncbi:MULTISPECIES: hypothetical protein [unclassified Actinomadura]|uniref:hypothetical protein n=1 Tax=unclassified Actinomadura TaxID=2626254 RepID=UPI0011EF7D2C|nr:hypothetical protein [Actinomadura sp. K4S16]